MAIIGEDSKVDHGVPAVLLGVPTDAPQLRALSLVRIYPDESGYAAIYGFGSLFVKDELSGDVVTSSQVLRPVVAKEESTLDTVCNSGLSQQQGMRLSTVF